MTKLQRLFAEHDQSPWLDNLTRGYLQDGTLARMVGDGIRGVTANPTIFAKAFQGSADYDEQFSPPARRPGQARLPAVPPEVLRRALGALGWPGGAPPPAPVGLDLHQEPRLSRHTLRRQPDRIRHRQHPARVHHPAFEDHGALARTIDVGVEEATEVMDQLARVGVDMDDVGLTLEDHDIATFLESFASVLAALDRPASSSGTELDGLGRLDVRADSRAGRTYEVGVAGHG